MFTKKDKPCYFFQIGRCTKGKACTHKHIKVSKEDFEKMAIPRSLSPGGKGKEGKGKTKLSPSDKGGKAAGRGNDDVRPADEDMVQAVNAFRQAAAIK